MRMKIGLMIACAVVMCSASVVDAQPGRGRGGAFGGGGGIGKLQLLRIAAIQKELELTDEQIVKCTKLAEELRGDRGNFGQGNRGRGEGEGRERGEGRGRGEGDQGGRRRPSSGNDDDEARSEFQAGEYFVQQGDNEEPRRRQFSEEDRARFVEEMQKRAAERQQKEDDGLAKILMPHQLKRLKEIYIQMQGVRALQVAEVAEELKITDKQKKEMQEVQEKAGQKMREEMREIFQSGDRDKIREKLTEMRAAVEKDVLGCLSSKQKSQFEAMKGKAFELSDEDRRSAFGFGQGGRGGRGQGGQDRPEGGRPDA